MTKRKALFIVFLAFGDVVFAQEKQPNQADVSVFKSDETLDDVKFRGDLDFHTEIERERLGARFSYGNESRRSFFHLFAEGFDASLSEELDMYGLGGGVKGAPRLNGDGAAFGLLMPYSVGISLVGGTGSALFPSDDDYVLYLELLADVGIGTDLYGFTPSAGIQLGALGGEVFGDADLTFTGVQVGVYAEVSYRHPSFPLYARLRLGSGDIEGSEFAIGAAW